MQSWDYVASLFVVGEAIEPERLAAVEAELGELCEQ